MGIKERAAPSRKPRYWNLPGKWVRMGDIVPAKEDEVGGHRGGKNPSIIFLADNLNLTHSRKLLFPTTSIIPTLW